MPSRFRTSFTHTAGHEPGRIVRGRIVNINLVKWTVDVVAQFDRKRYFGIQVGSGVYYHHSNGEGVGAFPEVNATCMVALPSDSSPPFVMSFVMPHEVVNDSSDAAPLGTSSHGQPPANTTDASFAAGRPRAKPGDIFLRTRDGNFVILHRGGVLQIGATELAQRIFIPLRNLVTDISENYAHHSTGGSIVWGLQEGPSQQSSPTQHMQTFRVFADDKYADIKLAVGKVLSPIPEPDGGIAMAEANVGQTKDSPLIYELTVSPKGFVAQSGDVAGPSTVKSAVLKFVFDRTGNTLFRCEGNLLLQVKKKLTLRVTGDIAVSTEGSGAISAKNGLNLDGGAYSHLKGAVVRLGEGVAPVARQGDLTSTAIAAAPVIFTFDSPPSVGGPIAGTLTSAEPFIGSILTGNQDVLA